MKSGNLLSLFTPLCDYMTLTAYDETLKSWAGQYCQNSRQSSDMRVRMYEGKQHSLDDGSIFIGEGFQDGKAHYIVQVSGEAANRLLYYGLKLTQHGIARVKRLDLQVTVPYPDKWSQFKFLIDMHEKGRMVQWRESKDVEGRAQTVYVGNRTSERFTRLYVKFSHGGERLLRLEVEYKGNRAEAMGRSILAGRRPKEYLAHELQTTFDHDGLTAVFAGSLDGAAPHTERVRVTSSTQKTEAWLLNQVLPALVKVLNAHDHDPRVAWAFIDTLNDYTERLQ